MSHLDVLIALGGGLFGAPKSEEAKKDGNPAGMQIHCSGFYLIDNSNYSLATFQPI